MAQILAFGDSITDGAYDEEGGWAARMQRFFMAENMKHDVVNDESHWFYNLGISADTAENVLGRIEVEAMARKIARPDKRSVVLFAIGINDSCAEGRAYDFQCTEQAFQNNLQQLVAFAKTYTTQIVFVGLTPVIESHTTPIYGDVWYANDRIKLFDSIVRQVASESNTEYIDLFSSMSELRDIDNYFIDGLHPNTKGHAWMYERIQPVVLKLLGDK